MTSLSGEWPTMETKPQECGWVCRLRAPLPRAQAQLEPSQPSKWLSPPLQSPAPAHLFAGDGPTRGWSGAQILCHPMRPGSSGRCGGEGPWGQGCRCLLGGSAEGTVPGLSGFPLGLERGCEQAAAGLRCLPHRPLCLSHRRGREHAWKTPKSRSAPGLWGLTSPPWATSTT